MRQACFRGQAATHHIELAIAQATDQITAERDLVSVPASKTPLYQRVHAPIERIANIRAEPGA